MRIGVLCSGGDAPGMNACVRAVVRTAAAGGHEVVGVRRGYQGLLEEDFWRDPDGRPRLTPRCVAGWSRAGGAFLHSSRSDQFRTEAGLKQAADVLRRHAIDGLVAIGGDGTLRGAVELGRWWNGRIVGCPGTIDNDLLGTDYTIGFSTAVHTAVEAVDKIRDTADSHERMFLVEVMGRHSGFLAVHTAVAAAAEIACVPETPTDVPKILNQLRELRARGKASVMMIVAEGDEEGGAQVLYEQLQAAGCPYPMRVVILGHLQRGGSPTPEDRILASQLGQWAVHALEEEASGVMAGCVGGQRRLTPLEETYARHKPIPSDLLELMESLAH